MTFILVQKKNPPLKDRCFGSRQSSHTCSQTIFNFWKSVGPLQCKHQATSDKGNSIKILVMHFFIKFLHKVVQKNANNIKTGDILLNLILIKLF